MNSELNVIFDVARKVRVCLRQWSSKVDFLVLVLDDYPVVFGMEFIGKVKEVLIAFVDSLIILEDGSTSMVPLSQEATL